VVEKAFKNQLKIAICKINKEKKAAIHYCLINFSRNEDLDVFKTEFENAVEELKKQTGGDDAKK
jgi:hypothetical protein